MLDKFNLDKINLEFKEEKPEVQASVERAHGDVGPSSLYGRVGDNMTFCGQGMKGHVGDRMWAWACKDFFRAFLSLFRLFSFREK